MAAVAIELGTLDLVWLAHARQGGNPDSAVMWAIWCGRVEDQRCLDPGQTLTVEVPMPCVPGGRQ